MSRVDDTWINSVVEKQAKLNELSDHQLDAVKEAVKDGITEGLNIGHYNGGIEAVNKLSASHDKLMGGLLTMRTFLAGISCIMIFALFVQTTHINNAFFGILIASIINTGGFLIIDKVVDYLKKKLKTNETGTSTKTG